MAHPHGRRMSKGTAWNGWRERNIGVSVGVESFFSSLFGERQHGIRPPWQRKTTWRRVCRRLVDHLARYIRQNVVTDRTHRGDLERAIRSLDRAVDAGASRRRARHPTLPEADRESEIVTSFAALCLVLL